VLRPWFVCSSVAKLATALANDVAAVIGWLPRGKSSCKATTRTLPMLRCGKVGKAAAEINGDDH